jgi:preprotein translocase subunit SecF
MDRNVKKFIYRVVIITFSVLVLEGSLELFRVTKAIPHIDSVYIYLSFGLNIVLGILSVIYIAFGIYVVVENANIKSKPKQVANEQNVNDGQSTNNDTDAV